MPKKRTHPKTAWYVINIKSRGEQTPQTYIDALNKIELDDPLVQLRGKRHMSLKSVSRGNYLENDGTPRSILMKLTSYDLLDPEAFYNKRDKENVSLILDPDIVANSKNAEIIFIPRIHRFALRKGSEISVNHMVKYFQGALDISSGNDTFDVIQVKDHDVIERILSSYEIYKVEADISFSNRDPSSGFRTVFDHKLRELNPDRFRLNMEGTRNAPLNNISDGLLEAVINTSESNGVVKARVRETEGSKVSTINTADYPLVLFVDPTSDDPNTTLYNEMVEKFDRRTENR